MKYLNQHCPPNPTLEYAESIDLSMYDEIHSIGGGSTIDVGKWLAKKYNLKHTVTPTTAGTGSEVTKFCVLNVHGKKTTFTDDKFIPDSYILDPTLVVSLPELHTLSSGLDALSQALEAHWSKNGTRESARYAETAAKLVQQNLKECLSHPDNLKARMNMLIAANFSGRAINITKTNVCHAISYPLTDEYGIPHGIACAESLKFFAKKFGYTETAQFLSTIELPYYDYNKERVADMVITNPKLLDCKEEITREDIINSLT